MGSLIAMRVALEYPTHVEGVVALSSTSRAATPEALTAFQQVYDAWISTPTPSEDLMNLSIAAWGGSPDVNCDRAMKIKKDWCERYNGLKVEGIAESLNTRDDIVERLSDIECPVLLIQGEKDSTWSKEEAEIAVKELKRGELRVVKDQGHMLIFLGNPQQINVWIEEFAKKLGF
jgi:pimeloyl-ACP methyl ester carboxylesterase